MLNVLGFANYHLIQSLNFPFPRPTWGLNPGYGSTAIMAIQGGKRVRSEKNWIQTR